jgi:radical SAM superfamily enzyme YgiQ (UPF0313 family)
MKVLLLSPPVTRDSPQAPLGLLMLRASLNGRHDVQILDLNFITDREKLSSVKPDIVGISSMSFQRDGVIELSRELKRNDVPVVVGGSHPTIAPEEMLRCPSIDYVIRGEAEEAFPKLLDALERDLQLTEVPNLGYKKNGKIRLNRVQQIRDLDSLPFPDYESIDMHKYRARGQHSTLEVPYETTRGCRFSCLFCCVNRLRGSFRAMSLDKVFREIERVTELYQMDSILLNFFDNNFLFSRERVSKFCRWLREKTWHSKVNWMCAARADQIDGPLAKEMSEAGLVKIFIGGEAGYNSALKLLHKGISISDVRTAVKTCVKHGIRAEVGFIVGFPWEKERDIRKTSSFALELAEMGANTGLYKCVPYPGTPLWKQLEKGKVRIDASNSSSFDFFSEKLVFDHPYLEDSYLDSVVRMHMNRQGTSEED